MRNLILMSILLVCIIPLKGSIIDISFSNKSLEKQMRISVLDSSEFSMSNLKEYMKLIGIKHAEIVIQQAIIESGWGKSYIFRHNKNLFGMRHPKIRATTSQGSRYSYAIYKTWTDSVKDYLLWQNIRYKGGDYYAFLIKSNYCTNPDYINLLKKIKINI